MSAKIFIFIRSRRYFRTPETGDAIPLPSFPKLRISIKAMGFPSIIHAHLYVSGKVITPGVMPCSSSGFKRSKRIPFSKVEKMIALGKKPPFARYPAISLKNEAWRVRRWYDGAAYGREGHGDSQTQSARLCLPTQKSLCLVRSQFGTHGKDFAPSTASALLVLAEELRMKLISRCLADTFCNLLVIK